jgi:undecaprenyl-diphosphatase
MELLVQSIKDVSAVGSSPMLIVLAAGAALFLVSRHEVRRLGVLLLSLGSGLYSSLLKYIFTEPRPEGFVPTGFIPWERILTPEVYSFPSTHTVVYTAFFGYLFYLSFALRGVNKLVRNSARSFCGVMLVFVGLSRVLLGAHFTKDVVAGYLFGLVYLGVLVVLDRSLVPRK